MLRKSLPGLPFSPRLLRNEDFGEVARAVSDGPTASKGGLYPDMTPGSYGIPVVNDELNRLPVGQTIEGYNRPNGLRIEKRRVPLGVVLFFYESECPRCKGLIPERNKVVYEAILKEGEDDGVSTRETDNVSVPHTPTGRCGSPCGKGASRANAASGLPATPAWRPPP